jgi:hypothetical protein
LPLVSTGENPQLFFCPKQIVSFKHFDEKEEEYSILPAVLFYKLVISINISGEKEK